MVFQAEIDDEARSNRHGDDEKDHRSAAGRPAKTNAASFGEPQARIEREHDEWRDAKEIAGKPLEAPAADESAAVVEMMRCEQVDLRPDGKDSERQRGQRGVYRERLVHRALIAP